MISGITKDDFFNFLLTFFVRIKNFYNLHLVSLSAGNKKKFTASYSIRQKGFGDSRDLQHTGIGAFKKFALFSVLCFAIFLSFSFTRQSGNDNPIINSMMSISPTENWSVNLGYSFGSASCTAGDVNGDGYADVIIGKKENTTNFTNDGKAFVFLGSSSGLSTSFAWSDIGANAGSSYGYRVATAGDVNGDGYDDIIVGEPGYKVDSSSRGRALVYYGSASGPSPTPSWTFVGSTTDWGRSVYTAGDVNNDGYDDVIIGSAYGGLDSIPTKGAAMVFYGSASGLSSTPNWKVGGAQSYGLFGFSSCTAGDVNNDGYSDVIVGGPNISSSTGQAFVYLGSSAGLSTTPVWTGTGESANYKYGNKVSFAGDVNGDGYDDIVVGAYNENAGGSGKVYVYYGSASGVSATANWTATGLPDANFGFSTSSAGDYNNDGFSDLVIGAKKDSSNGAAFVYKGSSTGLSANSVWSVYADNTVTAFGFETGTAGDVNNDGYDDVLITPFSPKAFVYHGSIDSGNVVVSGALSPNGTYQTLADAFAIINGTPQTGANILITIKGNTKEPPAGASLNSNSWSSLKIIPSGSITISDSTNSYAALIDFKGADNVTIDGLNSAGNSLTISNRSVGIKASTIHFINDASGNRIINCTILGASDMGLSGFSYGTVYFDNTNFSNGNDNNAISNCIIGPSGTNLPTNAVFFQGSTGDLTQNNSNDSILNCSIYDYYNGSLYSNGSNGVLINTGNTGIVISGNKFYQTALRSSSYPLYQKAIQINNAGGNNFTIANNIIGYSSSGGTGAYTLSFGNNFGGFDAIFLNVGTTEVSNVQGNVIKSITITGNNFGNNLFRGIFVAAGSVNIGNQFANIIGDSSSVSSIDITASAGSTCSVYGISITGTGNCITNNNGIYGIKFNMTNYAPSKLYGIYSAISGTWECKNNTIGGSIANSINNTGTNPDVLNRAIENTGGAAEISGNLIRNFTTQGGTIYSSNPVAFAAISVSSSYNQIISGNTIHTLTNTNSDVSGNGGAAHLLGMNISGSGTNVIEKNFIHSLKINSNIGIVRGIRVEGATNDFRNNMIRLGVDASGIGTNNPCEINGMTDIGGVNNFYHNSIYIGGNPVSGNSYSTWCMYSTSSSTRNYNNNILFNARSNNGSSGIHGAFRVNPLTGFTSNYNILFANGTGGIVGYTLGQQITIANWRTATGQDAASFSVNPQYLNPTGNSSSADLHINPNFPSPAEGLGINIPSVTTDFDNQLRSSFSPVDIGADAGNFIQYDVNQMSISYSLISQASNTVNVAFNSITITDADGINTTAGTKPRVYYKRKADTNTFNDNTNLTPGWKYSEASNASSPFNFNIDLLKLNTAPVPSDSIQYFVVAQDNASTPHVGINSGSFTQFPATVSLTSSAFPITGTINVFTFAPMTVSVAGAVTGNGYYVTLSAAFSAINANSQSSANINVSVTGNITETSTALLNSGSWASMIISPSGGAARTISGAIAAGQPLIIFNGADNVTIDGLNTGGNSLTFSNTTASSVPGTSTISISNDASNNVITRCKIFGSSSVGLSSQGGVISFGSGSSTGNDNNVISYCDIGPAGSNLPSKGVSFLIGSSVNDGDTISNCNIYDYFSSTTTSAGVYIGVGNSNASVTGNKFYQTSARTQTSGIQHSAVWIDNSTGNNFLITGNTIGYSASNGTGTYSLSAITGSKFNPVYLNVGSSVSSNVQGNIIAAINMSGTSSGNSSNAPFIGILVSGGSVNIGNTAGNRIGDTTTTGSINYSTSSSSNAEVTGIHIAGIANSIISNNLIGSMSASNASTGSANIFGIRQTTSGSSVCQNNIIGGSVANSIQTTSASTSTLMIGIQESGGSAKVTGNIIRNMTAAAGNPISYLASSIGILAFTNSNTDTISQNTIYAINNTNTSQSQVVSGILFYTSAGSNFIERNFIHSLSASSAAASINGIHTVSGTSVYQNNMIRLGINSQGAGINTGLVINGIYEAGGTNNFYFNSIYIGGNPTSGAAQTVSFRSTVTSSARNYKDNIFYNARSNSGSTGKHYAISIGGTAPLPAGASSNYNLLYASGSGSYTGLYNNTDRSNLALWQSATGLDSNSLSSNPNFNNPAGDFSNVNLHIGTFPSDAEGRGLDIPSVSRDFDNETRSDLSPVDIGADAGNFVTSDQHPMTISFTPIPNDSNKTIINLNGVTIDDSDGVETSESLKPRVYFKKRNDPNVFNDNTSSTTGWKYTVTASSFSPFDFSLDLSKLNSAVITSDTIQYFAVAQDMIAPFPHVYSNTVSFANYPSGVQLTSAAFPVSGTPNSFRIIKAPLSGDYTVGLSLFNSIAGTNITFEKITQKVMKEFPVTENDGTNTIVKNKLIEVEEETFVPMQNGSIYEGPLGIKRRDFPLMNMSAMSGVYATISAAVNDLQVWGASGQVRFLLLDNSYASETLPINITSWTGSSSVNTLTIKPNAGISPTISGNATSIFNLTNSANFILDGSNAEGGTSKNLTITNIANPGPVIRFTNESNKNTVKNCVLKGNTRGSNGVVFFTVTTGPNGNDSNLIQNNDITKNTQSPDFCIYNLGTGTTSAIKNSNNRIIGNRVFDFYSRGIADEGNSAGFLYEGNEIYSVTGQSNFQVGFRISASTVEGFTFRNNYIHDLKTSAATLIYGIEVNSIQASFTGEIYNNFISLSEANSTDVKGINESSTSNANLKIYFNSINIFGTVTGAKNSECYYRQNTSNTVLKNNIFVNSRNGGTGKHYAIRSNSPLNTLASNYNDIYAAGGTGNVFGKTDATERVNLAAWKTATGSDSNSISASPLYVSDNNLHIDSMQTSPVNNAGTPIAGITADFDYNTRSLTTPDIGADEFREYQPNITLNLTMFIEGFYNTGSDSQVSDTVKVNLRNSSSPFAVVDSAKGVAGPDGTVSLVFSNTPTASYYIEITHRNSVRTWSSGAVSLSQGGNVSYDFSNAASQAFGDNLKQIDATPLRFAIYSGDVNQDDIVDGSDGSLIDNDAANFNSGYLTSDLNGDMFVDGSDGAIADNNAANFVSAVTP